MLVFREEPLVLFNFMLIYSVSESNVRARIGA
jgi:hypothetical protein